jgi:hypothetical protein
MGPLLIADNHAAGPERGSSVDVPRSRPGNDLLAHVPLQRDAIVGQSLRDRRDLADICVVSTGISAGRSVGTMLLWVGAIGIGSEIWNLTPAGMTPSYCRRSSSACRPPRDLGSSSTRSLKAALSWTAHGRSMNRPGATRSVSAWGHRRRSARTRTLIGPAEASPTRARSSRNGGRNHLGTPSDIKSECARPRAQYVRR